MLSALHLKLTLPSSVDVHFKGYGMPRVRELQVLRVDICLVVVTYLDRFSQTGNRHFADFIDDLFGTDGAVQRVANLVRFLCLSKPPVTCTILIAPRI